MDSKGKLFTKLLSLFKPLVIGGILCLVFIIVSILVPLPIPPDQDFSMIYAANLGLIHGIGFYDHAGQLEMMATLVEQNPSEINIPYNIYPPHLALFTLFLAWFTPAQGARIWFFLNVTMVVLAAHLFLKGQSFKRRAIGLVLIVLYLPTIGNLVVGQYIAPLLLGLALTLDGVKSESSIRIAIGIILFSIKPHLGIGAILVVMAWLMFCRMRWAMRAILYAIVSGLFILGMAWLVDATWLMDYLGTIEQFRNLPTYEICELCSSLSVHLSRLIYGQPNTSVSLQIGLWLFLGIGLFFMLCRAWQLPLPSILGWVILLTFFVNPYLNNYDYMLLIQPVLIIISRRITVFEIITLLVVILIPWLSLLTGARFYTALGLSISSIVVFMLLIIHCRKATKPHLNAQLS